MSLLSAAAVRERAHEMLEIGLAGALPNFRIDLAKLDTTAAFVADVIRANYPDSESATARALATFCLFGPRSLGDIADEMQVAGRQPRALARNSISRSYRCCSTPAPAPTWHYRDPETGLTVGRSEGLALASLRMFEAGAIFGRSARSAARRCGAAD